MRARLVQPRVSHPEEREAVAKLGQRVRWGALCPPLAPVGAILGLSYFFRSLYLEEKPAGHGVTLVAFWACWVWTAAIVPVAIWLLAGLLSMVR